MTLSRIRFVNGDLHRIVLRMSSGREMDFLMKFSVDLITRWDLRWCVCERSSKNMDGDRRRNVSTIYGVLTAVVLDKKWGWRCLYAVVSENTMD